MHFTTLASGSSGNAILVGEGHRHLLVDCGISGKSLLANLSQIDIAGSEIEGIIVTHEHIDHIRGVGILARKLNIPIYATAGLWKAMSHSLGKLAENQRREISTSFSCAGLDVLLYPTSHDSRESYGLKIVRPPKDGKSHLVVGIATDSGRITEGMQKHLRGCDGLVVEANYDEERLHNGPYPAYLKRRISGHYGHLENSQMAEGLTEWIQENTQRIVLAHLSEENNTPEIALSTVLDILSAAKVSQKCPEVKVHVAPRHTPHELIILRE
ncbi:metal-dependent hydrolase, beta-lactamase superfamily I [Desulfosporosinus acidiphilus SJ4]|uniref:Metal-dependent hydrolase, beta-lactamase superfamily I n=1 Tax=Desulfosporosinus acidiphilus (strain DSM 22704 / JCM 16185 / SJ4) TaxID=646529 RepID=I4DCH7_DESAJ|nr:MBL fold metallo-hydrolase [Desulfosporosinus acidiphilus]AFM43501.1 metal-dependent hydrolase, beta-lactamase superfamily I [Desulfosporosinus acidiphilus SJ4]